MAGGVVKALGRLFDFLADFIAPAKPPTPEQQERNERAAAEGADQAARQEQEEALKWQILEQNRQRRYDDLTRGQTGRSPPRETERDEDE
jgi:hypothetical protein